MKKHDSLYQLICEGACNPNRAAIDAAAVQERVLLDASLPSTLTALRTLRHTPHTYRATDFYACTVCGHARQWGHLFSRHNPVDTGTDVV